MITLRDYQNDARYQVNTLLNASRHPIFVCSTGGGKTKTTVKIIEDRIKLKRRIFVLTPQEEIFDQWLKDCSEEGLNPGYINSEGIRGQNRNVYICMPQSLINILHLIPESIWPDEIITDECHHSRASTWESIYKFFKKANRLGLTATPKRLDNKPLSNIYTDIVETTTIKNLINKGHLAKPLSIVPEEYYMNIPIKNGDYCPVEQAKLLGDVRIIGDIINDYSRIYNGNPVLGACCTFNHAEMMTEKFNNAGWQWGHIHSKLSKFERRKLLNQIRNRELNGLCTVGIGIEGMDIPGLFGLLWLRRTTSLTIYMQLNGRVLRPMEGKKYGIIYDPVGNTFIHGMPDEERNWTLGGEEQEEIKTKVKICKKCGVVNNIDNEECHFCGNSFAKEDNEVFKKARKLPTMIDGELIIIESDGKSTLIKDHIEETKQEFQEKVDKKNREKEEIIIDDRKKVNILKDNLFKTRRPLFKETLRNFT